MTKADGFERMDVATDIHNDPKFRRLARLHPECLSVAFMAYIGLLGECWREGNRMEIVDAWPVLLPFRSDVVEAMIEVHLLDPDGRVPRMTWLTWYGTVAERRAANRERWRRSARSPRDIRADSAASVPSVPSYPSVPARARDDGSSEQEKRRRGGGLEHIAAILPAVAKGKP